MTKALLIAAAWIAAPAAAQIAAPPPIAAPIVGLGPDAAIDPARLALAKATIDHVLPPGSYARLVGSSTTAMMEGFMASWMNIRPSDIIPDGAARSSDATGGKTVREMMAERDPHWSERMRLTSAAMVEGMAPMLTRIEPRMREGLALVYARRFDTRQLADMNAFFATPSGTAYVRESLTLMQDPDFMKLMTEAAPILMREMPAIMARAKAATAHLPLPGSAGPGIAGGEAK